MPCYKTLFRTELGVGSSDFAKIQNSQQQVIRAMNNVAYWRRLSHYKLTNDKVDRQSDSKIACFSRLV